MVITYTNILQSIVIVNLIDLAYINVYELVSHVLESICSQVVSHLHEQLLTATKLQTLM